MTFEQYTELIANAVAETGYDGFCPSLCVPGDSIKMDVLDTELQDAGDEQLAREWVSALMAPDRKIYLAYRKGDRVVEVIEIEGSTVTNKAGIRVEPHFDPA